MACWTWVSGLLVGRETNEAWMRVSLGIFDFLVRENRDD